MRSKVIKLDTVVPRSRIVSEITTRLKLTRFGVKRQVEVVTRFFAPATSCDALYVGRRWVDSIADAKALHEADCQGIVDYVRQAEMSGSAV